MSRKLQVKLTAVVDDVCVPDTGNTVYLKKLDGTTVATASETPSGSGQYVATFTAVPCMGRWWNDTDELDELGEVWLGDVGQERQTFIFRKVKVYDSGESPSGAKNAQKTFTSGGTTLSDSAHPGSGEYSDGYIAPTLDGSTSNAFAVVPLVEITGHYQERMAYISTDPSLATGQVTFGISVSDYGDNYSDGKCYVDIKITSLD